MIFNGLTKEIQKALSNQKITVPTPIQEKAITIILEGHDLIGIAQTKNWKDSIICSTYSKYIIKIKYCM